MNEPNPVRITTKADAKILIVKLEEALDANNTPNPNDFTVNIESHKMLNIPFHPLALRYMMTWRGVDARNGKPLMIIAEVTDMNIEGAPKYEQKKRFEGILYAVSFSILQSKILDEYISEDDPRSSDVEYLRDAPGLVLVKDGKVVSRG